MAKQQLKSCDQGIHTSQTQLSSIPFTKNTMSTTSIVKDVSLSSQTQSSRIPYGSFGSKLFFSTKDENEINLWVSDGTDNGTQPLKTILKSNVSSGSMDWSMFIKLPDNFFTYNNKLYFTADFGIEGNELWATDGTEEGTTIVKDINTTSDSNPDNLTVFNNKLYFTADNGEIGNELWVTDGTEEGTTIVKDINTASGSNPDNLFVVNNKLYFTADDGETGTELWVTDGTEEGTTIVKNIHPQTTPSNQTVRGADFDDFIIFENKLYFTADDGEKGNELWVTDGTEGGTKNIKDINTFSGDGGDTTDSSNPGNLFVVNNKLYFTANNGIEGNELWVTDGTEEGTTIVKDINTFSGDDGDTTDSSNSGNLTVFNNKLYFTANNGIEGDELWVTDGTEEGTTIVKDINTASGSYPDNLFVVNNKLYFTADDGENGTELWVTDGTEEGTKNIKDINTNPYEDGDTTDSSHPDNLFVVNNKLYFTADDGENGRQIWTTDGSENGTIRVSDIPLTNDDNEDGESDEDTLIKSSEQFFEVGSQVFFTANNGSGQDVLWKLIPPEPNLGQDGGNGDGGGNDSPSPEPDIQSEQTPPEDIQETVTETNLENSSNESVNIVIGKENQGNSLTGTKLADKISGGSRQDVLKGNQGDDELIGREGNDILQGGRGVDLLRGGRGRDTLHGGRGNDSLNGGPGRDTLNGGRGDDRLSGGKGPDLLIARRGNDTLTGGDGRDTFKVKRGNHVITDFDLDKDVLQGRFPGATFTKGEDDGTLLSWNKGSILFENLSLDQAKTLI